ncbi:HD-GYP domain-containing protein [Polynucleobacter kasalickyi]|uniref:HD domain-containing protein n=1 Tax=Polynucleobacter kasalickyi TaxID=1938817 RepID=A0A1W2BF03_9BURK|nr:HD domain-containing phosphohydrolase [Polynucleobacter kasalickyi]SMC70928.1 HD domain-containing protein [Polynucleobacter kasalickyi]
MNSTAYIIYTIFLFFGMFSFAGAVLLLAQFKNERPEYVTAWIVGSLLLGVATVLLAMKDFIPEFYSYRLGNGVNAAGSVYFLYSCLSLLGKKLHFKVIALQAILVTIIFTMILEVVGQLIDIRYRPAVVALNAFLFNFFTTIVIFKYNQLRKVPFSFVLGMTSTLISTIWFLRFNFVMFFGVGYAFDGGSLNLITFTLLLVLSIARFMLFIAMVTSIEWGKKEDLITENYLMKIELAQKKVNQTETQYLETLNALAKARDDETGNHIIRTQHYVRLLCERLRLSLHYLNQINDEYIDLLFQAAPLHDIGKIGIPDQILLKKGPLTDNEWTVMKTHTLIGEAVLSSTELHKTEQSSVISKAIKIAGGHHEKWDGTGYPRGLAGQNIPLEARIMSLADMYDALVNKRVYKKAWSHEDAVKEIISKSGNQFDPLIVEAFVAEQANFNAIAIEFREEST